VTAFGTSARDEPRRYSVLRDMNRFRKLGFIDYRAGDALQVHSSLLNIVLHD
jgi:hypothetical protein